MRKISICADYRRNTDKKAYLRHDTQTAHQWSLIISAFRIIVSFYSATVFFILHTFAHQGDMISSFQQMFNLSQIFSFYVI